MSTFDNQPHFFLHPPFSNDVWYPIKINQPQDGEKTGIWLLGWYQIDAKFKKTGKMLTYWVHSDMHFDSNDKIDRVFNFTDRGPIRDASGEK